MTPRKADILICSYPSRTTKYGMWRVVERDGKYILQWIAGVAYPPKVTREVEISRQTAKAHWSYASKRYGGQLHYKAWRTLP